MRPYLPRRFCRRLLYLRPSQPISPIHLYHRPSLRPNIRSTRPSITPTFVQKRCFLSIFGDPEPEKDVATPSLDPGMKDMFNLAKRVHLHLRLPPQDKLMLAFNALVNSKIKYNRPVNDFHAIPLLQTLEVLENRHNLENMPSLDKDSVIAALRALNVVPEGGYNQVHKNLAVALTDALKRRSDKDTDPFPKTLTTILAATGDALESRTLLEAYYATNQDQERSAAPWVTVLVGFAEQKDQQQFERTVDLMKNLGIKFSPNVIRTIAVHYARNDDVLQAKGWFSKVDFSRTFNATNGSSLADDDFVYQVLLEFCLRNGEMEFGNSIMETAERNNSPFNKWPAIFQASAATGKTVEEMDDMLALMNRRADESQRGELRPNVEVFNGIIRFAISKNDPYLAERYFGLMEKWDVVPNAQSLLLQIEYRLIADDVDGALASYRTLQNTNKVNIPQHESLPIFNMLLRATTTSSKISNDTILQLVYDIYDPAIAFPPETIYALCKYHLQRDDYYNIVRLLQLYSYQYSIADRIKLRDLLVEFSLDPKNDTGRAWDTYMVWHQVFDRETTRDIRVKAMMSFFNRRRPDLATHVFTVMSTHERADTRPDLDTYIQAFQGIAATHEPEALEVVHNILKLDTDIEPCTPLRNALMLAYACCGFPGKAISFWRDITWSDEGPSMNSLYIIFRACEKAPSGRKVAGIVKNRLHEADVEFDLRLFTNWLVVLAAQGLYQEMWQEIKKIKDVTGEDPDMLCIGSLYNGMPGETGQQALEAFCLERYPEVWAQLMAHRDKYGSERNDWMIPRIQNLERSFPV